MWTALALRSLTCREVCGLRTSHSEELQKAWPRARIGLSPGCASSKGSVDATPTELSPYDMRPGRIRCAGCPGAGSQPERCAAYSWLSVAHHVRLRLGSDHVGLSPARRPGSVDATPRGGRPVTLTGGTGLWLTHQTMRPAPQSVEHTLMHWKLGDHHGSQFCRSGMWSPHQDTRPWHCRPGFQHRMGSALRVSGLGHTSGTSCHSLGGRRLRRT